MIHAKEVSRLLQSPVRSSVLSTEYVDRRLGSFCSYPLALTHSRCFIKWKSKVAPVPSSGIEKLETDTFKLQSFQTLTGVKFVITAEAGTPDLGAVLQEIYELYTDYVLKVTTVVFSSFGHIFGSQIFGSS